ncbi:ABC-type multidrug transport system, ATPase and permease component [Desulfosporosinus acidiphilus SJ4]|uniref:ABC-type multidrug transport system, ATPase and permease component n=1 Tax=Desulfosporosinus acidiphilus (strain DSM 22704 / JCM 16185 / SJ4) TaxID=646529 RepID=I4D4H0_DESAJ|nr:ABC transporter ATP-binding protein [Desulfosporosinus acidiphilus]AFM40694.1 ABC-type multidrug transport system, ATPase and permease component [Desulfosporosinus acidiphilus SJ4]
MLRLWRYMKSYTTLIVTAVILIFCQAMADLSLPDYMANIINQGIQQGGILNAVPVAVRKSEFSKLTLFMTSSEKAEVLKDYTLIDKSSEAYASYVQAYPTLKNEPIEVLTTTDQAEISKLNPVLGRAFLTVSGLEKMKADAKGGVISFNGRTIPANTDLFAMMSRLPPGQLTQINQDINKQFSALNDTLITQSAISSIKAEYAALGMNTNKIQTNYIGHTGIIMLLIALFSAACTIMVGLTSAIIAAGLARDLRKGIFSKVESFSNTEFDQFSTASLITRTTNDITQIQTLMVIMIRMVFYAPIMGVGGVIRALGKSNSMSWIIALAVIVLLGLILIVFSVAMPKFKLVQKLVDRLNLVTRENLSGMMVIRAFNTQKFEENRFDRANSDLTKTNLFVNRVMVIMMPAMTVIMNGTTLLIVWVGASQIANSGMQVGDMMAFMQYAIQIIMAFLMLSVMFIMIPRASVSAQRIAEVLEVKPVIADPKNPKSFTSQIKGELVFKDVSFRYPGAEEDALHGICLRALPNQTTAIIGSTGAGKTTLINLIPRYYDVTGGAILLDGVDVREVTQHELHEKIGYVPQRGILFSGTIESNLRFADDSASNEEIMKAAEIAQAVEFIKEKPDGLLTGISQGGTNVSGGQKQRLSIARALVKKPEIYIFDDSFSALDFKTDAALRKALKAETEGCTVIIVAQRISTIMNAEQIIVLEEGKVVGIGTHEELMETCKAYQEIALSQFSKEELA